MSFATPTRDMQYALNHMADFSRLEASGHYEDLSDDLTSAIFEEIAKFCDNEIAPMNWESDQNGAVLENGVVRTSPGFKEAYQQYVESGWGALAFPAEIGGQNLPSTLSVALVDALNAACMSFAIGTTLTTGAVKAVLHAGTDEQKKLYLEKLATGEWTGTMNLTEPQAGSDLSAIRTKAEPAGNGQYKISGQKIYITYGDHDIAENIVHLVLARLPDAPEGTAGISMFLVPKFHINEDGSLGERNDAHCVGLEEKMGLHGSPTCVMAFGERGECYGTLLGEENRGLKNMFVMMNSARLDVGVQGVGVAERAFQRALAYAQDRRQGRASGVRDGEQTPIINHPDIRRTLYLMKAMVEASRGICYANGVAYDLTHTAADEQTRKWASVREGLLTPISKAWSTDRANEVTSMGVQIHGGMGYVEETGAAQHMRDARIAAIYEGTNGIQAIDLVGRKLQSDGGAGARDFINDVRELITQLAGHTDEQLSVLATPFEDAIDALSASTDWLLEHAKNDPEEALAGASAYLKQFGNIAGGYYMARGVMSLAAAGDADPAWLASKKTLLNIYADNFLSEAVSLTSAVMGGIDSLPPIDAAVLAS